MDAFPQSPPTGAAGAETPRNWVEHQADRVRRHAAVSVILFTITFVAALGAFTDALDGMFTRAQDGCRAIGLCEPLPPLWLVGNLTEVRLGAANIPLVEAYTEGEDPVPTDLPPRIAAWPGRFITYRVEFRGLIGTECFMRWTLLDAVTEERVVDRWSVEQGRSRWETVHADAYPDGKWTVEADHQDAAVGTLWVPYLAPGAFRVEVELRNARGVYLDIERTPAFTVTAEDLPG